MLYFVSFTLILVGVVMYSLKTVPTVTQADSYDQMANEEQAIARLTMDLDGDAGSYTEPMPNELPNSTHKLIDEAQGGTEQEHLPSEARSILSEVQEDSE